MKINKFGSITIKDGNLTIADFDFNVGNETFKGDGDQWNAAIEAIFDFIRDQFKGYFKPVSMVYFEHAAPASPSDSAIAPPVAAGSVDTPVFQALLTNYFNAQYAAFRASSAAAFGKATKVEKELVAHIDAWGVQQRQYGWDQCATLNQDAIRQQRKRAEKAEAEMESWVHTNRIDELQRSLLFAGNRIQELESQLSAAKPYDLKA